MQYEDTILSAVSSLLLGLNEYVEHCGEKEEQEIVKKLVEKYRFLSDRNR